MNPIIKWAGGKRRILKNLLEYVPDDFDTYYEPFLGGGTLFLELDPETAVLGDMNPKLMNMYRTIKQFPDYVNHELRMMERCYNAAETEEEKKAYYYQVRTDFNRTDKPIANATMFLFLNKTCFNGLYRVNRKGGFNVPHGKYKKPAFPTKDQIFGLSSRLQGVSLTTASFDITIAKATSTDFIYFDPPYDLPNGHHKYTGIGFNKEDQRFLSRTFKGLGIAGVRCMLSNSDTPFIRELYAGCRIVEIQAHRSISQKASTRGSVTELLIMNWR